MTIEELKRIEENEIIRGMVEREIRRIREEEELANLRWSSELGAILPLNTRTVPGFKSWICWNGFQEGRHLNFDFACYLKKDNSIVLGLPPMRVRSMLDGVVRAVVAPWGCPDHQGIIVEHDVEGRALYAGYAHVEPLVQKGQEVKKGDTIARLYKGPGKKKGNLVRLGLVLAHQYNDSFWRSLRMEFLGKGIAGLEDVIDSAEVFPEMNTYVCNPQAAPKFVVSALGADTCTPAIANFKKLEHAFAFIPRPIEG